MKDSMICYYRMEDFDSALKVGDELLKLSPSNGRTMLWLAKSYIGKHDIDKANEMLSKILRVWENADDDYIPHQEAKQIWKELNSVKK